jgi:SAM-dependent methyltransferase
MPYRIRERGRDASHDGLVGSAADLLTESGQQLLAELAGLEITPDRALRLAEDLHGRYPADLVAAALTQQALRGAGQAKFGRAELMFFTRAGLEQASSDLTAAHSARRFADLDLVADLCCGIGGNLAALATAARHVLAVDADLVTLRFAVQNAAVHGLADRVTPVCADVRNLDLARGVDAVFIDPARRGRDRRFRAGDSEPPLDWCFGITSQVAAAGIKAAPGLPHNLFPPEWEIEFVAAGRDLKEALLWSPALATTARRATILPDGATLTAELAAPVPVGPPAEYLLDPNPAVTRAGLVEGLARRAGAWKIDPMIAFLACDRPAKTPFARTLRVLESMPWHERQVGRRLRELGIGAADIRRRGLAGDVPHIHRRLGLRGEGRATIVLTRREGKAWCLICSADVS